MKIAFLNIYGGVNNRGAESFTEELGKRLASKHQIDYYYGRDYAVKIIQPEHNVNNPLKRLFLDPASLSVLVFTLKIIITLWREKYDWVVPMNGFWQVFFCKFLSAKVLITGHSGPGWDERWNLYLKPDVFVATTGPTGQWAKKICSWTRVETIPYGIDIETFTKATPIKLDLEKPIILCPAAAVDYKRVDLAIKAVAKLKRGSLVHLGTGPILNQIKELGNQLLGNMRFRSIEVKYSDVPKYYAAADLVTLPSSSQENSPMVFLEAMASERFIVTTDAPRARWILGEAGVYVDPTDTNMYTNGFLAGLDRKDVNVIKNEAKRFSWVKVIQAYERLLEK